LPRHEPAEGEIECGGQGDQIDPMRRASRHLRCKPEKYPATATRLIIADS
jgi:hypothetical protein